MATPGGTNPFTLVGGMDLITCQLIEPGEAHDLCVEMGATPLAEIVDVDYGMAAYRNDVAVGSLLLSRLDLVSATALPTFSVLRHRVNKLMQESHQRQTRVVMLSEVAALVADDMEERVRLSCRVARGKPEHSMVLRDAGWQERPTCWTTIGHPYGGPGGGGQLQRVAEMWGEAV